MSEVQVAAPGTLRVPILTPGPSAAPTFIVDVPFIGDVPVRAVTPAPVIGTTTAPVVVPTVVPTAVPTVAPRRSPLTPAS